MRAAKSSMHNSTGAIGRLWHILLVLSIEDYRFGSNLAASPPPISAIFSHFDYPSIC